MFNKLKSLTSKLQRTASSIAIIEQSLFHGVILTLAKVKGQFLNERGRWKNSKIILNHSYINIKLLSQSIKEHGKYRQITNSVLLYSLLNNFVLKTLRKENTFHINKKT